MTAEWIEGEYRALEKRGLSEATCQKFGYKVGTNRAGRTVQIADYRDESGALVAQHVRDADKNFSWIGDAKQAGLFGQNLWRGKGKRIVVVEGELDALSVAQAFDLKWEVVSVPNGASNAKKSIQGALEFLEGYETVVLLFDQDDAGRKATDECVPLFSPGKVSVGYMPDHKDANECLLKVGVAALCRCIYDARPWRPGGIVNGSELWERITQKLEPGLPYPWEGLTAMTTGQRPGTLVTWASGSGLGKSTAVAQIAYDLAFPSDTKQAPQTVGYVALEEDVGRAGQRFLSHHLGKLCHLPGTVSEAEMRRAFDATMGTGRVWLHDHFGSTDSDALIAKLRFMAKGCGCQTIVIDHLSIIVSGMSIEDDERRTIDRTMTMLRTLVEETGITMHLVSHLKRVGDGGHEEGGRVSLAHLRGSQSIAQLSDIVVGIERNQQADTDAARLATLRVLKNRTTGETGIACRLRYDKTTGLLEAVPEPEQELDVPSDCPF